MRKKIKEIIEEITSSKSNAVTMSIKIDGNCLSTNFQSGDLEFDPFMDDGLRIASKYGQQIHEEIWEGVYFLIKINPETTKIERYDNFFGDEVLTISDGKTSLEVIFM